MRGSRLSEKLFLQHSDQLCHPVILCKKTEVVAQSFFLSVSGDLFNLWTEEITKPLFTKARIIFSYNAV